MPRACETKSRVWTSKPMELSDLTGSVGEWLRGSGSEADIVISTRVRLARNLRGYPFPTNRQSPAQREEIEELITRKIRRSGILDNGIFLNLAGASQLDCLLLVERHLISREHSRAEGDRSVAFAPNEMASIMINEEDHLRIQVIRSGMELHRCWEECNQIEEALAQMLEFAFHDQYGYLTACPTNVGTGMRVSLMLHLPGLVLTKQIEKVFESLSKISLAVRGLYGEGTSASGDFYQISNQVTLGRSEDEILQQLAQVVPQIIRYERSIRKTLISENKNGLEDRVWRALGILRSARTINSEETMQYLSSVRMGVNLGLIRDVPISMINQLFIQTQPAHLQTMKGCSLDPDERDIARASFIRNRLAEVN